MRLFLLMILSISCAACSVSHYNERAIPIEQAAYIQSFTDGRTDWDWIRVQVLAVDGQRLGYLGAGKHLTLSAGDHLLRILVEYDHEKEPACPCRAEFELSVSVLAHNDYVFKIDETAHSLTLWLQSKLLRERVSPALVTDKAMYESFDLPQFDLFEGLFESEKAVH